MLGWDDAHWRLQHATADRRGAPRAATGLLAHVSVSGSKRAPSGVAAEREGGGLLGQPNCPRCTKNNVAVLVSNAAPALDVP